MEKEKQKGGEVLELEQSSNIGNNSNISPVQASP
jgi:hypothetical protein